MKLIRTEDAAGQVLCHDITQIIPGEFKGARFKKGHIIQPEDIPVLLSIGKENLYVWEKKPGILHEDEAAALLYKAAAGQNIHGTEPREGKIELIADCDGLLKIDRRALLAVNSTPQMMIATIHGDLPVKKGAKLAGTRIIPLVIEQEKMDAMQAAAGPKPILNVLPFHQKKFAVITTGSEVFKGRIEDKFTPILEQKLAVYGCEMAFHKVCDDDPAGITAAILEAKAAGCELIFTTGGMSVDPDDRTPLAIRNTGAEIVTYGAPVLPGAMFLVSYLDGVPVCGLPGCVMYAKRTSELIPLCHPLPLTKVQIEFDLLPERRAVEARCTVKTSGVTGVEMEALTGVSTALLTIYDMCKAVDKGMELGEIHLVEKTGGKSGHYIRAEGGYV